MEGAIREVREETGLRVSGLIYKGLHEFVNPNLGERQQVAALAGCSGWRRGACRVAP